MDNETALALAFFRELIPGADRYLRREFDYGNAEGVAVRFAGNGETLRHAVRWSKFVIDDAGKTRNVLLPVTDEVREEWERQQQAYDDGDAVSPPNTTTWWLGDQEFYTHVETVVESTYKPNAPPEIEEIRQMFHDWLKDIARRGRIAIDALGES